MAQCQLNTAKVQNSTDDLVNQRTVLQECFDQKIQVTLPQVQLDCEDPFELNLKYEQVNALHQLQKYWIRSIALSQLARLP